MSEAPRNADGEEASEPSTRATAAALSDRLNPEQLEGVTHGSGPQLVLAGAGTGKTRVITFRIAWLVRELGVEPWRIAAVTFTNKAATEMRERVEVLLGGESEVFVGTFHRFALRLLRRYGDQVGIRRDFSIVDTTEQLATMKEALESEALDPSTFVPRAVLSQISTAKNQLLTVAEYEEQTSNYWETRVAIAYRAYQRLLRRAGALDFDDMIAYAVRLLEDHQELGDRMRRRLRYLLVDEFQDTNFAQLRLILALCGPGGNLTAVGDEDQSIYRWRGADIGNILNFEEVFPSATVRKLERNYRSTQTILDASGQLVANNRGRRGKRLWTEDEGGSRIVLYRGHDELDEARWLVRSVQRLHGDLDVSGEDDDGDGLRYRQMAILVRTNAQTRVVEDELRRRQVPYCLVAGTRFYERAEVKDLIAYLRVVRNPQDNLSLRRILNQPPRGVGKATLEALFREAEDYGQSLWDVLQLDRLAGMPTRGANGLRDLREIVLELRGAAEQLGLGELVDLLLERTRYADLYRKDDEESQVRLDNVRELRSAAHEFSEQYGGQRPALAKMEIEEDRLVGAADPSDPLTAFLDYVALVSDTDALDTELGLSLMTMHAAKGLEFEAVLVSGLEDGLIPHFNAEVDEEIEEERRLFYVGMTRARRHLLLSNCRRRRVAGRYQDQQESPFVAELPHDLIDVEEASGFARPVRASGVYDFFGRRPQPTAGRQPPAVPAALQRSSSPARPRRAARGGVLIEDLPATTVPLERGRGVRHPTLGAGVILEVEGEGDNAKLVVFFDSAGKRRLIAKYAGLQPLE